MKSLTALATALVLTIGTNQAAQAYEYKNECNLKKTLATVMVLSLTSAPTASTIMMDDHCRNAVLNLKEDAIKYRMTGEMSSFLNEGLQAGRQASPELNDDEIIEKFVNVKVD